MGWRRWGRAGTCTQSTAKSGTSILEGRVPLRLLGADGKFLVFCSVAEVYIICNSHYQVCA